MGSALSDAVPKWRSCWPTSMIEPAIRGSIHWWRRAAHTGARKGELLRMRIGDVDFAAGVVSIQEKKRAHGRRTPRRVPLSSRFGCDPVRLAKDSPWQRISVSPRPSMSNGARSGAARPGMCGTTGPAP